MRNISLSVVCRVLLFGSPGVAPLHRLARVPEPARSQGAGVCAVQIVLPVPGLLVGAPWIFALEPFS